MDNRDSLSHHHHSLTPNQSIGIGNSKGGPRAPPPKEGAWMADKKNFMRGTDLSV